MRILNKKILKILAFLVALILIIGALFIADAFLGNPISSSKAKKEIKEYVEENYKDRDFKIGEVKYSFKDISYFSYIESESSVDTKFYVHYKDGEIYRDDYETYVLGKFNTLIRLQEEYSDLLGKFILEELGYENKIIVIGKDNDVIEKLKLDMELDKSLFYNKEIILTLYLENLSDEEITEVMTEIHNKLVKNGDVFSEYALFIQGKESAFSLSGIKAEDIKSGNLLNIIKDNGFKK